MFLSFPDLTDDWSSRSAPDIYSFTPYTCTVNLIVKQFELITLANEFNWIDTSSHNPENGMCSIACIIILHVSVDMSYFHEIIYLGYWVASHFAINYCAFTNSSTGCVAFFVNQCILFFLQD